MYTPPPLQQGLRLHLNENALGCSPRVIEAISSLSPYESATYPDYRLVTSRVEAHFAVPPGWVQLVNGLDEGLHVAAASASKSHPSTLAVVPEPAFEMYGVCAEAVGLAVNRIAPGTNFEFPLDEVVAAAKGAAIVYLTDPNNPTGLGLPAGTVDTIAAATPHTSIVVDEAYADFSRRTLIGPLLDTHRNVIVGRTFAKAHGLAAFRIGALVAHPDALAPIRALMPPFSLNIAAITALIAALDDDPWMRAYVAMVDQSKARIYDWCRRLGLQYWPSEANFVLMKVGPRATAIVDQLAQQGIFVRDRSQAPGCAGCIRITAGTEDHMTRCLTAMETLLA